MVKCRVIRFDPDKWLRRYRIYLDPESKQIMEIPPPPEYVYHYTSKEKAKSIAKCGLIPSDKYHKGDMPILWFFPEPNIKYGEVEVRVKTDKNDPLWMRGYGGIPGSITYPDWIPPEKLSIRKVRK